MDKITVTDKDGKPVEVTVKPDGMYTFKQPNGKVKIEVTCKPIEAPWNNPFSDVSESDWYYEAGRHGVDQLMDFSDVSGEAWYAEAVRWAAGQGIAGGPSDG